MKKWFIITMVTVLIVGVVFSGCASPAPAPAPAQKQATEKVTVRIFGGSAGGSKHFSQELFGEALRKSHPDWNVRVITGILGITAWSMMSEGNMEFISEGITDMIHASKAGLYTGIKVPKQEIKWLIGHGTYDVLLLMLDKVPVNSIAELIQKKYPIKLHVGRPGTTPRSVVDETLAAYGISLKDIESWGGKLFPGSTADIPRLMGDEVAEASLYGTTMPNPPFTELSTKKKLKIAGVSEPEIRAKLKAAGFALTTIKAGTYDFIPKDVPTVGVPETIIVPAKMDNQMAYEITKALWEQRNYLITASVSLKDYLNTEFTQFMYQEYADLLHPGAKKYWVEQGILK